MGRTRDVSKILTSNTSILTLASASATYATKASSGLTLIIPSTISNTNGSASIATNGTVSFSAASSVSLNDVFNSTYTNYKILLRTLHSTTSGLQMRLRVGGSDLSSSVYQYETFLSGTGGITNYTTWNTTYSASLSSICSLDIFTPFTTEKTLMFANITSEFSATDVGGYVQTCTVNNTTSYTGFTLLTTSGTVTGEVSVYGYNK
jgi:hypothetical protein